MSSDAPACPHCGKPNAAVAKKKTNSAQGAGCLLMVLALFGSFVAPPALQWVMWLLLLVGLVIAIVNTRLK